MANAKKKEKIIKRYDKLSRFYDNLDSVGRGERNRRFEAVKLLDVRSDETILDVGTGSGSILPLLARDLQTGKLVAVDLSTKMLAAAQERIDAAGFSDKVELKEEDIEAMSFPDNYFDAVIATYTLTTVPDPAGMMRECARTLKPGGRMVILDTGPPTSKMGIPVYYWMRFTAALFGYTYINRRLEDYRPASLKIITEKRFLATTVYCTLLKKEDENPEKIE